VVVFCCQAKELAAVIVALPAQSAQILQSNAALAVEHKPVLASKPPSSKRSLFPLAKVKIGRKAAVTNKTRQQKIEAVIASAEMLLKDNSRLRLLCR